MKHYFHPLPNSDPEAVALLDAFATSQLPGEVSQISLSTRKFKVRSDGGEKVRSYSVVLVGGVPYVCITWKKTAPDGTINACLTRSQILYQEACHE